MRKPLMGFGIAVLGFYLLFWGAQILFPESIVGSVVLVLTAVAGIVIIQPGWNIKPSRPAQYWVVLYGLLIESAALAATVLSQSKIQTPYNIITSNNIVVLLPGIMAVRGVEELLFR